MKRIGLISDTHGHIDNRWKEVFAGCDEIWHAGDIGDIAVAEYLQGISPLRAVSGNIDGRPVRDMYPEVLTFTCESLSVLVIHIGGYPGNYPPAVRRLLDQESPGLFICGHSHILRVMRDAQRQQMLVMNPGAAGVEGFHRMKTVIRFVVNGSTVQDVEVIELGLRGKLPANN